MATRKRKPFEPRNKSTEQWYARQLRRIAKHVGAVVAMFPPGLPESDAVIRGTLDGYAETLTGWAQYAGTRMLDQVRRSEVNLWEEQSKQMAAEMRRVPTARVGLLMQERLDEQVALIKSIPTEAAERVHKLTLEALENSDRAATIRDEILRSGEVAEHRANTIARTEVARTASLLTEARSVDVGSIGYIWRTAGDSDVRDSHAEMEGQYVQWSTPPTLSDGTVTHAGQIYNCRCYPEPVLPRVGEY